MLDRLDERLEGVARIKVRALVRQCQLFAACCTGLPDLRTDSILVFARSPVTPDSWLHLVWCHDSSEEMDEIDELEYEVCKEMRARGYRCEASISMIWSFLKSLIITTSGDEVDLDALSRRLAHYVEFNA